MTSAAGVRAFVFSLVGACVTFSAACTPEEIVIASDKRSDGADGSRGDDDDKRGAEDGCKSTEDCGGEAALCERSSCKEPLGKCATRPPVCDPAPAPVCGCDGITYWNDCLRRAFGVTAATLGECPPGTSPCDPVLPPKDPKDPPPAVQSCPLGASCARLLSVGSSCDKPMPKGACWRLPARCPLDADANTGDGFVSCKDPKSPCTSTCDAIRSEEPMVRAASCP